MPPKTAQKTLRCAQCQRLFATQAALKQHTAASHSAAGKPLPQRGARRGRGNNRSASLAQNLSGAAFSNATPAPEQSCRLSGVERLASFNVGNGQNQPLIAFSKQVNATFAERLAHFGSAFQRVRFHSVVFEITTKCPSITSGGYVVGCVMDPTDDVKTLGALQAQGGAVVRKWWESTTIRMPVPPTEYFTSLRDDNVRLFSPGKILLMLDGIPSSPVWTTVTVRWDVTFRLPSLESEAPGAPKTINIEESLYSIKRQYALGDKTGEIGRIKSMVRGLPDQNLHPGLYYYRVPMFVVQYKEGVGDTGTKQFHFLLYKPDGRMYYASEPGADPDTTLWQSDLATQILVPKSTVGVLIQENYSLASSPPLGLMSEMTSGGNSSSTSIPHGDCSRVLMTGLASGSTESKLDSIISNLQSLIELLGAEKSPSSPSPSPLADSIS